MKKIVLLLLATFLGVLASDAANYPLRVRKYLLDRGVTDVNFRTDVRILTDRHGNLQILRWNVPGVPQPNINDLPDDEEAAVADLPENQRTWDGTKWVAAATNAVWTAWINSAYYVRVSGIQDSLAELRELLLAEGMETNVQPFSLPTAVEFVNSGVVTQELKAVRLLMSIHALTAAPTLVDDADVFDASEVPEDF